MGTNNRDEEVTYFIVGVIIGAIFAAAITMAVMSLLYDTEELNQKLYTNCILYNQASKSICSKVYLGE